jgi:hypothetical protein
MRSRYPTIRRSVAIEIAMRLVDGTGITIDDKVEWQGSGLDVDLRPLDRAVKELRDDLERATQMPDHEVFEGRLAAEVHAKLTDFNPEVLDDEGFWRYLAVSRFWWFIAWREAGPIRRGNLATYVDGHLPAESIPLRLFIRGQSVYDDGDYSRAWALERSADFWRSHVLRVRAGSTPHLTRALVDLQLRHRMTTDEMRRFARLVNRTWTNVVLYLYDDASSVELVEELYARLLTIEKSDNHSVELEI